MSLIIHFLNVGHGDCTIIEHPSGRVSVVDINCSETMDPTTAEELWGHEVMAAKLLSYFDHQTGRQARRIPTLDELFRRNYKLSLTDPVAYYLKNIRDQQGFVKPIWRLIVTHPDIDHMNGLHRLIDSGILVHNFWDSAHSKVVNEFLTESHRASWAAYGHVRSGDAGANVLRLHARTQGNSWYDPALGADHDWLQILSPTPWIAKKADNEKCWNNLSYILHLSHGGRRIILGGDAEAEVWSELHARYGEQLKCDILKAPHHGRDSAYANDAVKAMSPEFAIVSVGKKPDTDASNKYRQYCKNVLSTRFCGNIVVTIRDDGLVTLRKQHDQGRDNLFEELLRLERLRG